MQDTVDHADGAVPRTLADIIEDAPVRVWPLLRSAAAPRNGPRSGHSFQQGLRGDLRGTASGDCPRGGSGDGPARPSRGR